VVAIPGLLRRGLSATAERLQAEHRVVVRGEVLAIDREDAVDVGKRVGVAPREVEDARRLVERDAVLRELRVHESEVVERVLEAPLLLRHRRAEEGRLPIQGEQVVRLESHIRHLAAVKARRA